MDKESHELVLQFYREYIKRHENESARRVREYVDYLKRWFNPEVERCDGASYDCRIKYQEPMSYNVYFN